MTGRDRHLHSCLVKVVPKMGIGEGIQWAVEQRHWAPSGERKYLRRDEEHKWQEKWEGLEGFWESARRTVGPVDSTCWWTFERHLAPAGTLILRSCG